MRKLLIVFIIFAASCNSEQSEQIQTASKDTLAQSNTTAYDTTIKTATKPLTDKNDIIGIWASEGKEPLTVEINKDSIYYTEHFESHKYKLKGDSIFINYPDFVFAAKVYFTKDTLVMESEDGKSTFVKFNQ
jgi:hypothetical protein